MLLPLGHLSEFSLGVTDIVLPWSVDVVLRVSKELNPVGNPASYSGNCEQNCEHVSWESHGAVN